MKDEPKHIVDFSHKPKYDHVPIFRKNVFTDESEGEPGNGMWKLIIEFCAP